MQPSHKRRVVQTVDREAKSLTHDKKHDRGGRPVKSDADKADRDKGHEAGVTDSTDRVKKSRAMELNNEMHERLGFGLKSMYRSVLEEPLPDDMMALLDQLSDGLSDGADTSPAKNTKKRNGNDERG